MPKKLAHSDSVFQLPVTEVAFTTHSLQRLLEVDLSEQRLYVKENGAVVDSWLILERRRQHPDVHRALPDRGYKNDDPDDERLQPRCRRKHHRRSTRRRTSAGPCTSTAVRPSTACTGTTTSATPDEPRLRRHAGMACTADLRLGCRAASTSGSTTDLTSRSLREGRRGVYRGARTHHARGAWMARFDLSLPELES